MPSPLFSKKRLGIWALGIIVVLLALALIFGGLKRRTHLSYAESLILSIFGPTSKEASFSGYGLKRFWRHYIWLRGVAEENERLRLEVARLRAELIQAREHELEYERLVRLLKVAKSFRGRAVAAHIVGRPLGGRQGLVVIDKGQAEGVFPEMPVVAVTAQQGIGALVGQVVGVTKHYAKVLLITDPASAVDVFVQRSRQRAVLRGAGEGKCILDYVPAEADVREKDLVITSGLDGIYPKGILVGQVVRILPGREKGLFRNIEVLPAAPLYDMEEVLVLQRLGKTP